MTTAIYTGTEHPFLTFCPVMVGSEMLDEDDRPTGYVEVYPIHPDGKVSFVASDAAASDLQMEPEGTREVKTSYRLI